VASFFTNLLTFLIFMTSLILILLILIQRGRGGGLIGALGGSGGSSAFGSRAGDTFTRITLVVAGVWMVLIMVQILLPKV
jgi:preprotein translocase subunit SecG